MKITLKNVRLSFAEIFDPKAFSDGAEEKFSASFLYPKNHPQIKEIKTTIAAVAKEKWAAKADANLKALEAADRTCVHEGDSKDYDGYAGNLYISASSTKRTVVKDKDGTTPLTKSDGRPYAGCYVNAILDIWAMENKYGKRINATLLGVQFLKDGDAFVAGAVASDDDFEDLSAVEDAEDLT